MAGQIPTIIIIIINRLRPDKGRKSFYCVTGRCEHRYTIMSTPVSDDESSEHQKYAPKRFRKQARMPAASQLRGASPPMSTSRAQAQGDRGEASGLPSSGVDLGNEGPRRRLYDPEPVSQPQPQRRGYSVRARISWLAIVAACTALIVVIATI